MDRARLRQIIKEELNRAVNEAGIVPMVSPSEVRSIVNFFNSAGFESSMAEAIGGLEAATPEMVYKWLTGHRAQMEGFDGYSLIDLEAAAEQISDQILGGYHATPTSRRRKALMRQHFEQNIENPYGPDLTPDY